MSAGTRRKNSSVEQVVAGLRKRALEFKEGELVGSEDELVEYFSVSRPTLRQAAHLVIQEQLLTSRRGPGGGYFASRPDAKAVAHMAAIYLQTRSTSLIEVIRAIQPVKVEMVLSAVRNRDPETLALWKDLQDRDVGARQNGKYRDFLKSERRFGEVLGIACSNNVLQLFHSTLYEFCAYMRREEDVYADHPERVVEYWDQRAKLVDMIIEGDTEMATLMAPRATKLVLQWMIEDMKLDKSSISATNSLEYPGVRMFG